MEIKVCLPADAVCCYVHDLFYFWSAAILRGDGGTVMEVKMLAEDPFAEEFTYDPAVCDEIVANMAEGWSLDACAHFLGVPIETLELWAQQHRELGIAIRKGRSASVLWWEERLRTVASGGRGNLEAIQYGLRNRSRGARGWNLDHLLNKGKTELSSDPPMPSGEYADCESLSIEELEQLEKLLRKMGGTAQK